MADSTWWWLVAGALVALELLSGTFYLLMLALGAVAGALAAHLGGTLSTQLLAGAGVGSVATVFWHLRRQRSTSEPPAQANHNVNLDIGETVEVLHWKSDGTAEVRYRGATWTAIHRPGVSPSAGLHRVAELVGSRLLLDKC